MAQEVSRRPLTAEARVHARVSSCGICGGQSGIGTGFLRVLRFSQLSFFRGSPYSYIFWGVNNRPVGGRCSERHNLTPST
jgi:hypothetical protein